MPVHNAEIDVIIFLHSTNRDKSKCLHRTPFLEADDLTRKFYKTSFSHYNLLRAGCFFTTQKMSGFSTGKNIKFIA